MVRLFITINKQEKHHKSDISWNVDNYSVLNRVYFQVILHFTRTRI